MRNTVKRVPLEWDGVQYELAFTMLTLDILGEDFGLELDDIMSGGIDPSKTQGRRQILQIMYALLASDLINGDAFYMNNTFRQFQATLTFDVIVTLAETVTTVITQALPEANEETSTTTVGKSKTTARKQK